ncbi:hypothetical protein BB560_005426 [Smittium megazygosporum]|uniref:Uncharacterized protein n=1 Tax=Smittium megazygosporum TaxID=133381 RepID=A0A2T9Z5Z0_9FUNG|nr:hypothetical protein BB560_005426 [Smittium megazygosporum]
MPYHESAVIITLDSPYQSNKSKKLSYTQRKFVESRKEEENSNLPPEQLTHNLCWVMAVCGFMRPSVIERVGDTKTQITDSYVRFVEVSSKEKRGGSTIKKHINTLINLIELDNGKMKPKAHVLGSILATTAGATYEDVVTQGLWLSQGIFEMCYELSRRSRDNMATLVLENSF